MGKDFDAWNIQKKIIDERDGNGYVHEREIWWCQIGLNVGHEQDGKNAHFERPVLIIKKFSRSAVLIVPLTTRVKDNEYHVSFVHDTTPFAAIISQIKLISTKRLLRKLRKMPVDTFEYIRWRIVHMILVQ